jgi:RsmE family RNA methyltransferase
VGSREEPQLLLLDNETGRQRLAELDLSGASHVLVAVGSERGWTGAERSGFSEAGFRPVRLGARILRTETACAAGTAVALSRMGLL